MVSEDYGAEAHILKFLLDKENNADNLEFLRALGYVPEYKNKQTFLAGALARFNIASGYFENQQYPCVNDCHHC